MINLDAQRQDSKENLIHQRKQLQRPISGLADDIQKQRQGASALPMTDDEKNVNHGSHKIGTIPERVRQDRLSAADFRTNNEKCRDANGGTTKFSNKAEEQQSPSNLVITYAKDRLEESQESNEMKVSAAEKHLDKISSRSNGENQIKSDIQESKQKQEIQPEKRTAENALLKLKGCDLNYALAQEILTKFLFRSIRKQKQLFCYYREKGIFEEMDFDSFCSLMHLVYAKYSKIDAQLTRSMLRETYERILTNPTLHIDANAFDQETTLMNTKNGVIDLSSMRLYEHRPCYGFTSVIPIKYTGKPVDTPLFDRALQTAFAKKDNRKFFMQAFSYLISNIRGKKIAFVFIGAGNTGKSMFLKLLSQFVGGDAFVSSITLDQLSKRFATSALYRKKINQAGELDVKKITSSAVIKSVIGGDIIDAEFKGRDHFSFQCRTKCVFATNQLPVLDAQVREDAFFDRFQFIEFDSPIPRDQQIPDFEKILLAREGEGILYKCIGTLSQLVKNNLQFDISEQAKKIKERFQNEKNPVELFLEERCVRDISCAATNQELFSEYVQYCRENCFDAQFSNHLFVKEIIRITGLPKKKLHRHRESSALWGIEGIALKLEHLEQ